MKPTERWYAFFNRNVPNTVLRLCVLCAGFFSMACAQFARRAFPEAPLSPCPEKPNAGKR